MNQLLNLKKIDSFISKIVKIGIKISFYLSLLATLILSIYKYIYISPTLYYIGISLFKSSLFFIVGFIIYGFLFDKVKQELQK